MALACFKSKNFSEGKRKRRRAKRLSEGEREYLQALQEFIWSLRPQYFITLNFNYSNDAAQQAKQKYWDGRPRQDWMRNFDAMLISQFIKRRVSSVAENLRVSWVPFEEFTSSGNLHYHILLSLPERHRYADHTMTIRQLHHKVRRIITEILEEFFEKASVKVKAIWSKGGVDYATKRVRRSSDLEWKYWRQARKNLDANRINTGDQSSTNGATDDTNKFNSKLRHDIKSSSRIASATGAVQTPAKVGRRQIVAADDSTATVIAASHSRTSDPTRSFHFGSYSYGSVIKAILSKARGWFTMTVADG